MFVIFFRFSQLTFACVGILTLLSVSRSENVPEKIAFENAFIFWENSLKTRLTATKWSAWRILNSDPNFKGNFLLINKRLFLIFQFWHRIPTEIAWSWLLVQQVKKCFVFRTVVWLHCPVTYMFWNRSKSFNILSDVFFSEFRRMFEENLEERSRRTFWPRNKNGTENSKNVWWPVKRSTNISVNFSIKYVFL